MAGEARTNAFVLASATVMLGPQAALYDLNPTQNSIGLVKNFKCEDSPTFVDLTQGPKGQTVYSVLTARPVKASCEVYEFTAANMSYGLGLSNNALTETYTDAAVGTAALTGNTGSPVITTTVNTPSDFSALYTAGSWVMFQDNANPDHAHYAQLTANATITGSGPYVMTLQFANQGLKTGNNFPAGARVVLVNALQIGSTDEQPFLSCKVTATLPERNEPQTMIFPKVRITKGFSVAFTTDTFANLPFEFSPYTLLSSDPFYSQFGGNQLGLLFSAN